MKSDKASDFIAYLDLADVSTWAQLQDKYPDKITEEDLWDTSTTR